MSTYRLYQSPEGNVVRVKMGFSWRAFLVGSLTTMVRRLWWLPVVAAAGWYFTGFVDRAPDLGSRGIAIGVALLGVVCLYMLFCGMNGNRWLVESLRRRGFRMVGEER